jgi:hypothetical protein
MKLPQIALPRFILSAALPLVAVMLFTAKPVEAA